MSLHAATALSLLCGAAAALEAPSSASASASSFGHDWTTARKAWWGDFGYTLLTDEQAKWLANNYAVVSLEKCTGSAQHVKTEEGIYQTAAQLKKFNPNVKVMYYWSVSQAGIGCYDANSTFMSHPEWWLKDDNGNVVGAGGDQNGQRIDVTNPEAVDWWLSVPFEAKYNNSLIDGILADDSGYNVFPNISSTRLDALYNGKLAMIGKLQAKFDARAEGGVVFGNGLSEYDQSPSDPHNRRILDHTAGVQNEHFAAFEQVNPKTGDLNIPKVADVLDQIEWAASYQGGSKQVFCSFWAGPYVGFENGDPKYADNSQPCGMSKNCTAVERNRGWQAELEKYLPFNLAAFLSVAGPNTWITQGVWYELHQGFVPCPEDPTSCMAPPGFYADYLDKPLGSPLGPRKLTGNYTWQRQFEHATVTLDLVSPTGGSSIVFKS